MQTTIIKKEYSGVFQDTLTYSSISKKKSTADKRSNQSLIEGFTPHQQAEFDKGITIENYAKSRGIVL